MPLIIHFLLGLSERNPVRKVRHDRKDAQLLPTAGHAVPGKAVGIVAVGEIVDA